MDQEPENVVPNTANFGVYDQVLSKAVLQIVVESQPDSLEFTNFVYTVAMEIQELCKIRKPITRPDNLMYSSEKYKTFLDELTYFLREMGCPYSKLITYDLVNQLKNRSGRLLLTEYLAFELLVARILNNDYLKDIFVARIERANEAVGVDKKNILLNLILKQESPKITPEIFYFMIETKIQVLIYKDGVQKTGDLLYNKALPYKYYKFLDGNFDTIYAEYLEMREDLVHELSLMAQRAAQRKPTGLGNNIVSEASPFENVIIQAQCLNITEIRTAVGTPLVYMEQNVIEEMRHGHGIVLTAPINNEREIQPENVNMPQMQLALHEGGESSDEKNRYDMGASGSGETSSALENINNGNPNTDPKITNDDQDLVNVEGGNGELVVANEDYARRGRSHRRGSRGARRGDMGRGEHGFAYGEQNFMSLSTGFVGNHGLNAGVAGAQGQRMPFNALYQNNFALASAQGFQHQQVVPMRYFRSRQLLMYMRNNNIVYELQDIFQLSYQLN